MALAELKQTTNSTEWDTQESFCNKFGFTPEGKGFTKEVRGKKYYFEQTIDPDALLEVVEVQRKAWGWAETDLAPTHILALAGDTGGGIFSAYDEDGKIVGFAGGFGGGVDTLTGKKTIISSMLAMAGDGYRSQGIGKELKLIQAYFAYQNGYEVMKWFYDPERGENASLNMRKLGARAEEFWINKYGQMTSTLYGPVPTDRFRAVWRFTESSVIDRITGENEPLSRNEVSGIPIATPYLTPNSEKVLVEISGNIDDLPERDKIERRFELRKILTHYFTEQKYIATEFITEVVNGTRKNYYLLEKPQS